MRKKDVSLIVPVMNEAGNLKIFVERVKEVIPREFSFELIFICDPSNDGTEETLKKIAQPDPNLKVIFLADRAGQSNAIRAGLDHAVGNCAITMDVDFQDPPELIPLLLEKWREGFEIVHTKRSSRLVDSLIYRSLTGIAYTFLSFLTGGRVKKNVGDYRLYSRTALQFVLQVNDPNPFWRGISVMSGLKSTTINYSRGERLSGMTKYSKFLASPLVGMRGVASFSNKPLVFIQALAISVSLFGLLVFAWFILTFFGNPSFPRGIPTITILIVTLFALQFVCNAIFSAYLLVLVEQTRKRPHYLIKSTLGINQVKDRKNLKE